jgi:hypothetical protein
LFTVFRKTALKTGDFARTVIGTRKGKEPQEAQEAQEE